MRPSTSPSAIQHWEILFPAGARVVALPSWERPRLLLPADTLSERVSGSAFFPAFRASGRLYRWALRLRAVMAIGVDRVARDGQFVLSDFLADALPGAQVRAVQVGVPGRMCKLTAQLEDEAGAVVGYLRCAHFPLARQRLHHEYHLLRSLPPDAGPRPLKFGSFAGCEILLLSAVTGRTPRPRLDPTPALQRLCRSLVGTTTHSLSAHPWVRANCFGADGCARLLDALSGRSWPVAIQHGDLAPWNLIQDPDRNLTAIDWEYGLADGFAGLDLAQYVLQVAVLIKRARPAHARAHAIRALLASEELGLNEREAAALVSLGARNAYQSATLAGCHHQFWVQVWRRAVWEQGLHA